METNPANWLTLARMLAVFPILYFLLKDEPYFSALAFSFFIAVSLTDFLDGYVARLKGMVTPFGKFLDPLADKVLVVSVLLGFVMLGQIPLWMALLVIFRETAVTLLRMGNVQKYTPTMLAKSKTAVQMTGISALIFLRCLSVEPETTGFLSFFIMAVIVSITLASGLNYFLRV